MHLYVILTAILFTIGAVASLFNLKLLPLVFYTLLAIIGWTGVSAGFVNAHYYVVWTLVFFVISFIWELINDSIELTSLIFGVWAIVLLFY